MADIIQTRRGTTAEWALADPVLAQGELGLDMDLLILKAGDAVTPWSGLQALFSTGGSKKPLRARSADFTDATHFDHPFIIGQDLGIFFNEINRYLDDSEWNGTATGIEILIPDFDATANSFTFYIHIL